MAKKMTQAMIEDLYAFGKQVYQKSISLENATKAMINKYPADAIAESSAEYYIQLYSDYINGKYKSWNQNSALIKYYVEHICKEAGEEAVENALSAAREYVNRNRPSLSGWLDSLSRENDEVTEDTEVSETLFFPDAFNNRLSRRFITSLIAKPFVILTGNSGTGKTRIATQFAKSFEVKLENGENNYELISVGADWTDNTAILGYYNPMGNEGEGEYIETPILKLFLRAIDNPDYPFFLILDEMNLSHVERYFADFLSHMETPETGFKIEGYSDSEYTYPDNLFVIGTVNIDETTYMFSPKVLDRANVIEFKPDKADVLSLFDQHSFTESIDAANDQTIKAFMALARRIRVDGADIDLTAAKDVFDKIYTILEKNDFEFAFRTVKEMCRYFHAASETEGAEFDLNNSIDEQIVQKLLPKIHGNRRAIGDLLTELIKFAEVDNNFVISAEKLKQMEKKLENTQYVSFI